MAQVGQIKEIFPVCHQPTSRREHAIINQHAFEKYSMQREDVLTALAGKFKIIPFSNGY